MSAADAGVACAAAAAAAAAGGGGGDHSPEQVEDADPDSFGYSTSVIIELFQDAKLGATVSGSSELYHLHVSPSLPSPSP